MKVKNLSDSFLWECNGNRKLPKSNPSYLKRYFQRNYRINNPSSQKILIHYFGKDDKVAQEDCHGDMKKYKTRSQ